MSATFTEDDIRDLDRYLREHLTQIAGEKDSKVCDEDFQVIGEFERLLRDIRHDPLLFEGLLEHYEMGVTTEVSFEDLLLHLNDEGILTQLIMKWRLERGV